VRLLPRAPPSLGASSSLRLCVLSSQRKAGQWELLRQEPPREWDHRNLHSLRVVGVIARLLGRGLCLPRGPLHESVAQRGARPRPLPSRRVSASMSRCKQVAAGARFCVREVLLFVLVAGEALGSLGRLNLAVGGVALCAAIVRLDQVESGQRGRLMTSGTRRRSRSAVGTMWTVTVCAVI
jgi:hypothetical protein